MTQSQDKKQRIASLLNASHLLKKAESKSPNDNFHEYEKLQQQRAQEPIVLADQQALWSENPKARFIITAIITTVCGVIAYVLVDGFLSMPSQADLETTVNVAQVSTQDQQEEVTKDLVGEIKADNAIGNLGAEVKKIDNTVLKQESKRPVTQQTPVKQETIPKTKTTQIIEPKNLPPVRNVVAQKPIRNNISIPQKPIPKPVPKPQKIIRKTTIPEAQADINQQILAATEAGVYYGQALGC